MLHVDISGFIIRQVTSWSPRGRQHSWSTIISRRIPTSPLFSLKSWSICFARHCEPLDVLAIVHCFHLTLISIAIFISLSSSFFFVCRLPQLHMVGRPLLICCGAAILLFDRPSLFLLQHWGHWKPPGCYQFLLPHFREARRSYHHRGR